jgi:hypothetical protein
MHSLCFGCHKGIDEAIGLNVAARTKLFLAGSGTPAPYADYAALTKIG